MPNDNSWISAAISKARQQCVDVPESVWTQVDALLRGRISQRPIPALELASVARQLIDDMVTPPKEEEHH
jgi:hypothetical protein